MPHIGKCVMTVGIAELDHKVREEIILKVMAFTQFDEGDDPNFEHDFAAFKHDGESYYWKIDYYDLDYQFGSPEPWNQEVTRRVLTIMKAEEY